jgi:hypothetical protein
MVTAKHNAKEYIEAHGVTVDKVWKVWSAGESDFPGYETYLFTDEDGKPYTAVEKGDEFIVKPGWVQFDPRYEESL